MIYLFFWVLSICLNMCSTQIATYRSKRLPDEAKSLPDVCHDILPIVSDWIPDVFILLVCMIDLAFPFVYSIYSGDNSAGIEFEHFLIVSSN